MKQVSFLGDALARISDFPLQARKETGFQLDRVQRGLDPEDWKPMTGIGSGVREIRVREPSGAFRIIYLATYADAVYVLHAFQKKTQTTSQKDIDLATARFNLLLKRKAR